MDSFWLGVTEAAAQMSMWEVLAVMLGYAYLILAMRQNSLCWYAAFGSTAIFSWLFFDVKLVMESALNVYYLLMAVYGWWVWRTGRENTNEQLPIQRWTWHKHTAAWTVILLLTVISGALLDHNSDAALPYLDSFTTWGSVVTTYMVARKVLENWLYWQVFNTGAIVLYIDRELYLTALMMMTYLVMAIIGWIIWRRDFSKQSAGSHADSEATRPSAS